MGAAAGVLQGVRPHVVVVVGVGVVAGAVVVVVVHLRGVIWEHVLDVAMQVVHGSVAVVVVVDVAVAVPVHVESVAGEVAVHVRRRRGAVERVARGLVARVRLFAGAGRGLVDVGVPVVVVVQVEREPVRAVVRCGEDACQGL